ncbi:cache domain-containing sensor histidine kinase [Vallitalea guaymasensis]|uniref:cache domain-containing sensor histidine kinase n=1 Tax=Vallitalea guaymasensis TaxID=1185412 RepID=UPI00272D3A49|nr:sensor histidine kinase [Vallitalea guaymasensis]
MKKVTIRSKLFLSICLLTTLSLICISYVVYVLFFQTLKTNEIQYSIQSSNETKHNIELFLKLVTNTSTLLSSNEEILNELKRDISPNDTEKAMIENEVNTMLKNIISVNEFIKGIYIIGHDSQFFTSDWAIRENQLREKYDSMLNKDMSLEEFYTSIHPNTYHLFSELYVISYVKPVFLFPSGENLGTIIIDINYNYLEEIFTMSSIENSEKVIVINSKGETIFTFPYNVRLDNVIEENPQLLTLEKTKLNTKVFGKESIIVSQIIDNSDWKIITIRATDKIHKNTNYLGSMAITIFLVVIVISLIASFLVSNALTKPIKKLITKIKLVEQGNLNVRITVRSNDELGQLSTSFNNMIIKINELIKKILDQQKKKADMEFKILQAQINPHFLYNTLDSIKWLAILQNVDNISDMVTAIINLLKYNISKEDVSVKLSEEIDSIKNYITVQNYRYGNIFKVIYSFEENTLDCIVLRFILQPIVENAIFHGFENLDDNGIIEIKAFIRDNNLVIEVIDNGTGMDEKTLDNIKNDKHLRKKFSGIGIQNIQERIQLYFGNEYGLSYSSQVGKGTKVTLTLPYQFSDN